MNLEFDDILAELVEEERHPHRGGQLVVWHRAKTVADLATGASAPNGRMTTSTVHNLYCGLKPVAALTVARLLEERGLDESVDVGTALGSGEAGVSVAHVCSHTAGLTCPDALSFYLMRDAERALALRVDRLLGEARAGQAGYSDVAGWQLLRTLIEHLTGEPAADVIARDARQAGAGAGLWFRTSGGDDVVSTIGCYVDGRLRMPLLHDTTERFWNPGFPVANGGFASMSSLCSWFGAVVDCASGAHVPGLPSPATTRRWIAPASSVVGGITGTRGFGLGVVAPLTANAYGTSLGERSFGHAGFLGNSFAAADLDLGVVVTCMTNCLEPDPEAALERRRGQVIDAVVARLREAELVAW